MCFVLLWAATALMATETSLECFLWTYRIKQHTHDWHCGYAHTIAGTLWYLVYDLHSFDRWWLVRFFFNFGHFYWKSQVSFYTLRLDGEKVIFYPLIKDIKRTEMFDVDHCGIKGAFVQLSVIVCKMSLKSLKGCCWSATKGPEVRFFIWIILSGKIRLQKHSFGIFT